MVPFYLGVTLRFSCILAAAFFFIICSRLSADMSEDDDDAGFPLPPAALLPPGSCDSAADVEAVPPFPFPFPDLGGVDGELPAFAAAAARLESPWNAGEGSNLGGWPTPRGLRGLGLLRLAARPASPMGLFGPPADDRAGT